MTYKFEPLSINYNRKRSWFRLSVNIANSDYCTNSCGIFIAIEIAKIFIRIKPIGQIQP